MADSIEPQILNSMKPKMGKQRFGYKEIRHSHPKLEDVLAWHSGHELFSNQRAQTWDWSHH